MAWLFDAQSGQRCFLHGYHTIGRLHGSVDTVADLPIVSKLHMAIEWRSGSGWFARDLSSNGTWLNNTKLATQEAQLLTLGRSLFLGAPDGYELQVADLDPPADLLIPDNAALAPIILDPHQLLPNADHPTLALFFDRSSGTWHSDEFGVAGTQRLFAGSKLNIAGEDWVLHLARTEAATEQLAQHTIASRDIAMLFNVSLDEEKTRLTVLLGADSYNLGYRAHHYLLLHLARHRQQQQLDGVDACESGWIDAELCAAELGISVEHLNIQIHRFRKQISGHTILAGADNLFVERRPGEIRLAPQLSEVSKGGIVEFSTRKP
ncbi:MAG: FHA domain-containing protein [Pseudomonadota bacterium]